MIEIKNLTKTYITKGKVKTVFKNLSLRLETGKSVALLGCNGAGKSTLLQLIGGIDYPDSGSIQTDRSISWPVGISGGFQGSLTARENVTFVSKIYTGNDKDLIKEKVSLVEDFAEIGEAFDRPFKTYSKGMKSRVTFGLSLAFKFDVYLIDEITAAGDARFRNRCKKALDELRRTSDFIMVNHNLYGLKEHCDKALLLHEGKMLEYSDLDKAISIHRELMNNPELFEKYKKENLK